MTTTPNPDGKLSTREKISYGFGDFASCLYWKSISDFLSIFYTDVLGITAAAAGTLQGVSRSFDAIFDIIIGMLGDRTKSRWGKFRPYLLFTCLPMSAVGVLTFMVPDFDAKGRLIWAYVTYNALMLIYTTINIPYTAMLGVLTPNTTERATLSSYKFIGAFGGGIVIAACLMNMTKVGGWLNASTPAQGWFWSFVIVGVVSALSFLLVFFNTKERVQPPKSQQTSVVKDLGDLFTNGPWWILLATTITFIFFCSLRGSVETYYFKYYVGPQTLFGHTYTWESLVSIFKTSNQALSLVGAFFVPFIVRRIGGKPTFVLLFTIAIIATASFALLKPDQIWAILGVNLLGSITGGPLSALMAAMYADTADYAEWKTGRRATGLVFSASIFAQKFGWGWGGAISLIMLNSVGFVANQAQTPETLHGLVRLMSVYPACFGILAILILVILYPLNETKMAQIASDLQARRASEAAACETGQP
ncbi:MAG TPA: MFS transporter [Candidatus Didemnitutus sp.]|nr:MFS transporter [Candidatus Didemnitutus sp.]